MSSLIPFPQRPDRIPAGELAAAAALPQANTANASVAPRNRRHSAPLWVCAALLGVAALLGDLALRSYLERAQNLAALYRSDRQLDRIDHLRQAASPPTIADQIEALDIAALDSVDTTLRVRLSAALRNSTSMAGDNAADLDALLLGARATLDRQLEAGAADTAASVSRARAATTAGLLLALLLLGGAGWWIAREQTRRASIERELTGALEDSRALSDSLRRLGEFGEMLQSCRSLAEAMLMLRSAAPALLGAIDGGVFLLTADRRRVQRTGGWGVARLATAPVFDTGDCWALRRGQAHPPTDEGHPACCAHLDAAPDAAGTALCLPLSAQGQAIGVVCLNAYHAIDPAQRRLCRAVAEQLSLSLANLGLQESLHLQSLRDPLTGLFNRRYLDESLPRELARAARRRAALSLLIVDIDHFKRINDCFGHDAGDAVLAQVGALLGARLRGEDIACRIGGEEFVLIMPDATADAAARRADALRKAVCALRLRAHGREIGEVTVSIGVAQWNGISQSMQDLRHAADCALYEAKESGRNRVVVAPGA